MPGQPTGKRKGVDPTPPRWLRKITRDLVLFVAGLGLTFHEAIFRDGPERPTLIALYAAMMGLPIVLRAQEKKNEFERSEADE